MTGTQQDCTQAPSQDPPLKIAVSAGELSGDQHGARLLRSLRENNRAIDARGMGGAELEAAGMELCVDYRKSGGLNGFNIPLILYRSLGAASRMIRLLYRWRPDVLVVIDYPDFNMRLAKIARFLGIRVVYFIPPKAWAWRSYRAKALRQNVSTLALIFPFESEFYKKHKHPNAVYVGHPFCEGEFSPHITKEERAAFLESCNLDPGKPVIAALPGSRFAEVERHLSIMHDALKLVRQTHPTLQVLIPLAPSLDEAKIRSMFPDEDWIQTVQGESNRVMQCADLGLLKSGTCNLEAVFFGLPHVCMYTIPPITATIIRTFVKLKEFSLVNIIRSGTTRELMQEEATPANLAREVRTILDDTAYRETMLTGFQEIVQTLQSYDSHPEFDGTRSAASRAAQLVALEAARGKKGRGGLRRLLAYVKNYTRQFFFAMGAMIIYGATDGGLPYLIKYILDGVFAEQNRTLLQLLPLILIVFALFRAAADFGQKFLMARIGHNIVRDIRNQLTRHILTLSPGYFIRKSSADILSRFTSDVLLVRTLLTNSLTSIVRDSVRITALLVAAFAMDPFLALMTFIIFPLAIIPVYQFGRRMRKLSKRGQDAIGNLSTIVQEATLGNKVVKIFGREDFEVDRFALENERLNRTFIKSEFVRAISGPVNELLATFAIAGVIVYGGLSVMNGTRSQGDFIAFLAAVFLLYDPFKKISNLNNQIQQGLSGAERIFEVLDTESEIQEVESPVALTESDFSVTFEQVTFSHEGSERNALEDIHVTIPNGSTCALVGFSGAGKSTMVDMVPRFIDPDRGRVKIGDVDIKNLKLDELRAAIAMVGQHTFLFNDTIYANIAYGKEGATEEEVMAAAKAAFAYDFVSALPHGFATRVGESGLSLSGGERQRIAIARALLKDAPLLILDEATASLDNKAEREVQLALENLSRDRTSIIIAHRLSTVRDADCILVLEDGRIVEAGSHDELLKQGGAYARLHALQFEKAGTAAPSAPSLEVVN